MRLAEQVRREILSYTQAKTLEQRFIIAKNRMISLGFGADVLPTFCRTCNDFVCYGNDAHKCGDISTTCILCLENVSAEDRKKNNHSCETKFRGLNGCGNSTIESDTRELAEELHQDPQMLIAFMAVHMALAECSDNHPQKTATSSSTDTPLAYMRNLDRSPCGYCKGTQIAWLLNEVAVLATATAELTITSNTARAELSDLIGDLSGLIRANYKLSQENATLRAENAKLKPENGGTTTSSASARDHEGIAGGDEDEGDETEEEYRSMCERNGVEFGTIL